MIYLDNASTSFPKPETVYRKMDYYLRNVCANPGRGSHKLSFESAREVAKTRELAAKLFGISDHTRIVFTLNCTESINIALNGLLKSGDHVIISSVEHNSVLRPLENLTKYGVSYSIAQVSTAGEIQNEEIVKLITHKTRLIVFSHASNVTGSVLPIERIGALAKEKRILFMVDAAQTAGKLNIDVESDSIDILAFPGHKGLLGPQGTGGLWMREGIDIEPLKFGGTGSHSESKTQPNMLPDKFESGTLNTPGIAGLGAGIEYILDRGLENIRSAELDLFEYLVSKASVVPNINIYGNLSVEKNTGILAFNFVGVKSTEVAHVLDRAFDIAVRAGLHCSPLAHEAINTFPDGCVRVSLGAFNTKNDIDKLIDSLEVISLELEA